MACLGQPGITPHPQALLCTGSQAQMMLVRGQRSPAWEGPNCCVQFPGCWLQLEGAGQDALSVNTWSQCC